MSLPDRDSIQTFGGPYADYSPVIDSSTDASSAGFNPMLSDVAMLGLPAVRAWVRFTPAGTGTPTLASHMAMWGTGAGVAPTIARTSTGIYTVTWPSLVADQVPAGAAGYFGNHTLNLLASTGQTEGSTYFAVQGSASANVGTYAIFNTSNVLADPNGPTILVIAY
jgi:hypothetical protein